MTVLSLIEQLQSIDDALSAANSIYNNDDIMTGGMYGVIRCLEEYRKMFTEREVRYVGEKC